jgi:hypothetical protein
MMHAYRSRPAADVALGYAADQEGNGVAYAAIATGTSLGTVRIPFHVRRLPGVDGREVGYAAVAAVGNHLRARGFGRVRLRVDDAHVVADLVGTKVVPPSLAMAYVKTRCVLHGFLSARLEPAESIETTDLATRARAEITLNAAA